MTVRVLKFGGTSVADASRIGDVAKIVESTRSERSAPVVVVSALAGVTDLLDQALVSVHREDREGLESVLADIERRHRWVVSHGVQDSSRRHHLNLIVDAAFESIRGTLRSIRQLGELTPKARDGVLAAGESLSGPIVCAVLQDRSVQAEWIDPRDWLATDETFGRAVVDMEATRGRAMDRFHQVVEAGGVPLTGGFVGASAGGETTTLGRGGSDTSAAILAACLGAERLQIWTDVDGLMSADPRHVVDARTLPVVDYDEASGLAHYGARVLHPSCLAPVASLEIPVEVRNTLNPDRSGTRIVSREKGLGEEAAGDGIVGVASRERITILRVKRVDARADGPFVSSVMDICRGRKVSTEMMVASAGEVHLVLPEGAQTAEALTPLRELGDVQVDDTCSLVAVIGSALARDAVCRAKVMAAIARWEPRLVVLGAAESSLLAVLPRAALGEAVRGLHQQFFAGVDTR
ncbi:MAG: aspartate kinase [Acidobacteriota bacterium]|nr:aspartate kinase [Acidobacteriota bacterium]MDH3785083.1 aspartate kinase [Acidobacteriota bacterium]